MSGLPPFMQMAYSVPEVSVDINSLIPMPARVRIAMQFLQSLTHKTMPKVAISETLIEQINGQELSTAERNAQATACNLINDYFLGKLKPDFWDKLLVEDYQADCTQSAQEVSANPSRYLRCFSCLDEIKTDCIICNGAGHVLITPVVGK